ncbi:down syndrome cell adhesion molecule [Caerostris extrusa]|uniref:Down syndrome cell adhesion molecule n=1 Tax=Caerostris extrusa TaxID=172846 RepID=A0AAV4UXV8_CAEEX|nr:down syndrome cell adhesion molecule [Caerostris extrusa]
MTSKILDLSLMAARQENMNRIRPHHINIALKKDPDFVKRFITTMVPKSKFIKLDECISIKPPDSPGNILATEIGSRAITIRWTPPYTGNSPIVSYKIQHKLSSETWGNGDRTSSVSERETSAVIRGLKPVTSYHVRLMAKNGIGWSEASQAVHITTAEDAPEGAPTAVHAVASSSNTIHVSWQVPTQKKDLRHGTVKGYYVGYKPYGGSDNYVYQTVEVQEILKKKLF